MKKMLFLALMAFVFMSCSNDEGVTPDPINEELEPTEEISAEDPMPTEFTFKYLGETYTSGYTFAEDSSFIFTNDIYRNTLNQINKDSTLSMVVINGTMEYITKSSLKQYQPQATSISSRGLSNALLSLWNDANGKGRWVGYRYHTSPEYYPPYPETPATGGQVAYIGSKMARKISSLDFYGEFVELFKGRDYKGPSIKFHGRTYVPNLKAYPIPDGRFNQWGFWEYYYDKNGNYTYRTSWNDEIESFKMY